MTASDTRQHTTHARGRGRLLLAGASMVVSAVLLHLAARQRWAVAPPVLGGRSIEDHLFDYSWPADPWQNVGTAAQVFGAAHLLLALAVCAALGLRRGQARAAAVAGCVVAAAFGLVGVHALVSGVLGAPTVLQAAVPALVLSLAAPVGLVVLAVSWRGVSPLRAASCLALLGATAPGYLAATFLVAPALTGYQSFDTTPLTESVVAAAVAAAGLLLLVDALAGQLSVRPSRSRGR